MLIASMNSSVTHQPCTNYSMPSDVGWWFGLNYSQNGVKHLILHVAPIIASSFNTGC